MKIPPALLSLEVGGFKLPEKGSERLAQKSKKRKSCEHPHESPMV